MAGSTVTDPLLVIDDRQSRPLQPLLDGEAEVPADGLADVWAPTSIDEARMWREQLREEMRPLVESIARMRDRGLLD